MKKSYIILIAIMLTAYTTIQCVTVAELSNKLTGLQNKLDELKSNPLLKQTADPGVKKESDLQTSVNTIISEINTLIADANNAKTEFGNAMNYWNTNLQNLQKDANASDQIIENTIEQVTLASKFALPNTGIFFLYKQLNKSSFETIENIQTLGKKYVTAETKPNMKELQQKIHNFWYMMGGDGSGNNKSQSTYISHFSSQVENIDFYIISAKVTFKTIFNGVHKFVETIGESFESLDKAVKELVEKNNNDDLENMLDEDDDEEDDEEDDEDDDEEDGEEEEDDNEEEDENENPDGLD